MASKNVPWPKVNKFASIVMKWNTFNFLKYLGFPLFQGRLKKNDFNFVIKKLHFKLAGWKGRLLNKPGRMTLANLVLTSFPVYPTLWFPKSICDNIDAIVRNFIWHKKPNESRG